MEYNCSDGLDDDYDGLTDCDDYDCYFDSACYGTTGGSTTGGTTGGSCTTDGSPTLVSTTTQTSTYNYSTPIGATNNMVSLSCGSSLQVQ